MCCAKSRTLFWVTALSSCCWFVVQSISPAPAQTPQDIAWCEGKDGASVDQRIRGCTALIKSGKFEGINLSMVFELRGRAYLYGSAKPDLDAAIRDYSEAIRLNPQKASSFYARGDAYKVKAVQSSGNERKTLVALSIKDFTENMRLTPAPKPLDFINRSNAYSLNGEYDRALGDLNEALRLDPSDKAEALVNRCRLYARLDRWPESLADCNESLNRKD